MTAYSSTLYSQNIPAGTGHGFNQGSQHMHATVALPAAMALNDTMNFGYIPPGAIVTGATLKAQSQLDSNGSPLLTFDLGVTGTTNLWKAAITTVGQSVGVSGDTTIATTGVLYKNTSGAKLAVVGKIHAAPATGVAGNVEVDIAYYVEDAVGSAP